MYPVSEEWNRQLAAQIREASGLLRLEIGCFDENLAQQTQLELPAEDWKITTQSDTGLPAESVLSSGQDGSFSKPPALTVSFSKAVDFKGICLNFGCLHLPPAQISVSIQTADGQETNHPFENLESVASLAVTAENVKRVVISFLKMPCEYAKLAVHEVRFGQGYIYTEQDVLELTETKTLSPAGLELPRAELDFSLNNASGVFDADSGNPIHAFLRENQPVRLWYGLRWKSGEEWIPAGKWYLQSWSTQQRSAKFKAIDKISVLNKTTFEKGIYTLKWKRLADMAKSVLADAGLTEAEWYLSAEFLKYAMAPLPIISHAQALQLLANRGRMNLYSDRTGRVCIAPIKSQPVATIEKMQMFESPSIQQSTQLKNVTAFWMLRSYYPNTRESVAQLRVSAQEGVVRVEHGILLYPEIQCTPQAQVNAQHYARVSYISIPNQSGEFTVEITGNKISEVKYPMSVENAAEGEILEIENPLMDVQTSVEVLEWVKQQYNHKLEYELELRGMPQLDVGDWVQLWTGESGQIVENKLSYNGAFHQVLKILA